MDIKVKNAAEGCDPRDGVRILVDGPMPGGCEMGTVRVDLWPRSLAPGKKTAELMIEGPHRWAEFEDAYFEELDNNSFWVDIIRDRALEGRVTLLYNSGDPEHNLAVAIRDYILDRSRKARAA